MSAPNWDLFRVQSAPNLAFLPTDKENSLTKFFTQDRIPVAGSVQVLKSLKVHLIAWAQSWQLHSVYPTFFLRNMKILFARYP